LLGAQQTNSLQGYAITGINNDETAKIYWLYVSPEARGQKLGGLLLDRLMVILPERGVRRVSLVTHNYQDYYSKYGFMLEGSDQLYGVDMKVMSYSW
jgi:ribosomal protein S18 acetylase RimI-like enzyme